MGPERKANLAAADAAERKRQEFDALLAVSRRLMQEIQVLAAQTQKLAREHTELARQHAELLEAYKRRKS